MMIEPLEAPLEGKDLKNSQTKPDRTIGERKDQSESA